MSIADRDELFDAVKSRHRTLRVGGALATTVGILLAAFVGYEWFIRQTSHEVIAIVAAAAVLFGVQLLIFSTLTSMLLVLHQEQVKQLQHLDE